MKLIPLTQGLFAMVDDADFETVSQFKWFAYKAHRRFYAGRKIRKPNGKQATQSMHQFLLPGVTEIDHQDGNGLNNRRENARSSTHQQNMQGFQRKRLGTASKFRGVSWHKQHLKWSAQIKTNGKSIHLGYFMDETDAAHAYDAAAIFYFGEWASTNFPIGDITIA